MDNLTQDNTNQKLYSLNHDDLVSGPRVLADKLSKVDKLTDELAYLLVKREYKLFLCNVIDNPCFDKIKLSPRFINSLIQVCIEVELTYEERVYCNSMIYKELAKINNTYLQKLYYILAMVVNRSIVNRLMNCGVNQVLSSYLAVARKSSFEPKDNISRLNFSMMCSGSEVMTIQRITDIYCSIFNDVNDIKQLFLTTIRDVFVFNSDEDWITDKILQTANNMNIAILSIIETLELSSIESILRDYYAMVEIEDLDDSEVRISIKNLNKEIFPNISYIVGNLAKQNIFFP